MNKKTILAVVCIYIFFYILNYLTPMCFGDDYVYAFIWEGHSMYEPMSEQVRRLSSFHDLLVSQWSHYFTGNGRAISHTIAQFFLWMGKGIFNIFNALISVLLIMEIYWCANKGVVTLDFKISRLIFIFFALWAFTPAFSQVFLWLSGACNYLWTAVLLLAFLLPYIHKFYFFEDDHSRRIWFTLGMFFLGVLAGWSNENSICWIILALLVFISANWKKHKLDIWMVTGFTGLIVGYALLIFAPGNVARLQMETDVASGWINNGLLKMHIDMLVVILCFHFLLWYYNLRSLLILKDGALKNDAVKREKLLVQSLCVLSFGMTGMMVFSPNFPPRSAFPGTIMLIIAASLLLRSQNEYLVSLIRKSVKRLLVVVGSIFFLISTAATLYSFYDYHVQIQKILSIVNHSEQAKEKIMMIPSLKPVSKTVANISGFRLLYYTMSDNEKDWRNVAFSRYYGIKGIRMIKREIE